MKLVDILARELKVWPGDWHACAQESNGMIAGFKSCELVFDDLSGWNNAENNAYIPLSRDVAGKQTMADDWPKAIVTRAQWQASVDALTPSVATGSGLDILAALPYAQESHKEWNGEGLPPVGAVCECHLPGELTNNYSWVEAKVIWHNGPTECAVVRSTSKLAWCDEFRPIRTPEQIAAEDLRKIIESGLNGAKSLTQVIDEILAAGYRKFEIVDN